MESIEKDIKVKKVIRKNISIEIKKDLIEDDLVFDENIENMIETEYIEEKLDEFKQVNDVKIEYIYLIKLREFIRTNEDIYKLGRTSQLNFSRLNSYPKFSVLICQLMCFDSARCERELIKLCKMNYKHSIYGNEYFEGNPYLIMKDMIYMVNKINDEFMFKNNNLKILFENALTMDGKYDKNETFEECIDKTDDNISISSSELLSNGSETVDDDNKISIIEDNKDDYIEEDKELFENKEKDPDYNIVNNIEYFKDSFFEGDIKICWEHMTEYDMAKTLYKLEFKDKLIFTNINKKQQCFMYNDYYWIMIENDKIINESIKNLQKYYIEKIEKYKHKLPEKKYSMYSKKILNINTISNCKNIINILKKELFRENIEWNKNKNIFIFEDCIYDFEEGQFVDGNKDDFMTISCGYNFKDYIDKNVEKEKKDILQYLHSILNNEEESIYLLKLMSSCLIQENKEKEGYFLVGNKNDGKDIIMQLLNKSFGKYYGLMDMTYYKSYDKNKYIFDKTFNKVLYSYDENKEPINIITENFESVTNYEKIKGQSFNTKEVIDFYPGKIIIQQDYMPYFNKVNDKLIDKIVIINFPYTFMKSIDEVKTKPDIYKIYDNDLIEKLKSDEYKFVFIMLLFEYYKLYQKEGLIKTVSIEHNFKNYVLTEEYVQKWFLSNFVYEDKSENIKLKDICTIFKISNNVSKCSVDFLRSSLFKMKKVNENIKYLNGIENIKNYKYIGKENIIFEHEKSIIDLFLKYILSQMEESKKDISNHKWNIKIWKARDLFNLFIDWKNKTEHKDVEYNIIKFGLELKNKYGFIEKKISKECSTYFIVYEDVIKYFKDKNIKYIEEDNTKNEFNMIEFVNQKYIKTDNETDFIKIDDIKNEFMMSEFYEKFSKIEKRYYNKKFFVDFFEKTFVINYRERMKINKIDYRNILIKMKKKE